MGIATCFTTGSPSARKYSDNIFYRYTHQLLAADAEAIQRHVLEHDINFMLVDSATPAVGEPESAQMTTEYFRALRSLRITTVTIGHVAKAGKENEPFGSIFWRNLPRANFRVNGAHEPGADTFTLGLKHTKSNNGKHLRDIGLEVSFTGDAVYFSKADLSNVPELAETLTLKARIEAALTHGAKTVKDLAEELNTSDANVRYKLNQFKDRDFIQLETNLGTPKWGMLGDVDL